MATSGVAAGHAHMGGDARDGPFQLAHVLRHAAGDPADHFVGKNKPRPQRQAAENLAARGEIGRIDRTTMPLTNG
jgi:hypothetical protein